MCWSDGGAGYCSMFKLVGRTIGPPQYYMIFEGGGKHADSGVYVFQRLNFAGLLSVCSGIFQNQRMLFSLGNGRCFLEPLGVKLVVPRSLHVFRKFQRQIDSFALTCPNRTEACFSLSLVAGLETGIP